MIVTVTADKIAIEPKRHSIVSFSLTSGTALALIEAGSYL